MSTLKQIKDKYSLTICCFQLKRSISVHGTEVLVVLSLRLKKLKPYEQIILTNKSTYIGYLTKINRSVAKTVLSYQQNVLKYEVSTVYFASDFSAPEDYIRDDR